MFNYEYLREVSFWRDFLGEGKPRIVLNFDDQSAIVGTELLAFTVRWPGIPGDVKPFESEIREDDLFTLTDLQKALEGEEIDAYEEEEELEHEEASDL